LSVLRKSVVSSDDARSMPRSTLPRPAAAVSSTSLYVKGEAAVTPGAWRTSAARLRVFDAPVPVAQDPDVRVGPRSCCGGRTRTRS